MPGMNDGTSAKLLIEIGAGPDDDVEDLDRQSLNLRDELLELDLDSVEPVVEAAAPAGAKGPTGESVGALLVTISDSAVLVALIGTLKAWIGRVRGRTVTIQVGKDKITVGQVSAEQQARLIESWIKEHGQG